MAYLFWNTGTIVWSPLQERFRLPFLFGEGVYVIWKETPLGGKTALYVGAGDIPERIQRHAQEWLSYYAFGAPSLRVSWASTWPWEQDGIERYLAEVYRPLLGERHPDAEPIPVDLPWETAWTRLNASHVEFLHPNLQRMSRSWSRDTQPDLPSLPPYPPRFLWR